MPLARNVARKDMNKNSTENAGAFAGRVAKAAPGEAA
jgi:hypothetical protein